jgi:serine/threonine-protein phosphatase 2A regulatory subunit B'
MFKGLKKKFASKDKGGAPASSGSSAPSGSEKKTTDKPKSKRKPPSEEKTSSGSKSSTARKGAAQPAPQARPLTKADLLKPIATFSETSSVNKPQLLISKLRLCQVMFDWYDDNNAKDNRAKEVKRQQLLELVEFIGNVGKNKNVFNEAVLVQIIQMVSSNLCRALPPRTNEGGPNGAVEEEDPVYEPSWPHLQIVYEFFLRFIVSGDVDVRTLKKHITGKFVLRLLELFDSEDHRERDYLKTILHRIYAKFMSLRAYIRKAINNVFFIFIYETERHNGIAELLEILGSIINGFALPLKAEHKSFLKNLLTPMHKVRPLALFHQQLSYCVTQFVDKDPTLAVPVLTGLIKYWPTTNSGKEVLFLNEVEELLELTQPQEFKTLLVPLFRQLNRSIGSPHFQVAERALFLWHNEYISGLIADHRKEVLPVIYSVLHVNSQSHWNSTVSSLTLNVLKIFMELDSQLVEECSKRNQDEQPKREAAEQLRKETWKKLTEAENKATTNAKTKT